MPRLLTMEPDAAAAASAAAVDVRRLVGADDADAAIELMEQTWGSGQPWSKELLIAMQASGRLVLGAFREGAMLGFSLGFFADEGGMHFHSHMLAVRQEARRAGIGFALKLAQRDVCLDAGVTVMRWTFDPLRTRNAAFNLNKLGAVADAFERDFYGWMDDEQSLGDRGDRLWARWDLRGSVRSGDPTGRVAVPEDYWERKASDPAAAQGIREEVAERLETAFGSGRVAVVFDEGGYGFA